jgi:hypothetical protein
LVWRKKFCHYNLFCLCLFTPVYQSTALFENDLPSRVKIGSEGPLLPDRGLCASLIGLLVCCLVQYIQHTVSIFNGCILTVKWILLFRILSKALGRDKGTYGSLFIQDVKCGSNHREKDDTKRMGYWKLVLKHKGLLRDFLAFVFGLANGDNLSHCRSSQLDCCFLGRIVNFESKDK